MILYQNSLIILDYEPRTDILMVDWPSVESYFLPEVKQTLQTLVEYVRNYDVKRLLIDASKSTTTPGLIDSPEYKDMVRQFAHDIINTRLQKTARIIALDAYREEKTQKISAELREEMKFSIQNKDFSNKAEAKEWLLS